MMRRITIAFFLTILLWGSNVNATDDTGVFFHEAWAEIPQALPITQEHVVNPDLILHRYGPARDSIKKSGAPFHAESYVWTGLVDSTWALSLMHRQSSADLTVPGALVRWRLMSWNTIYVIVKTADGTWLVSDQGSPRQDDTWEVEELLVAELTWSRLDIDRVVRGEAVSGPELDRIDEIGFTDLRDKPCVRVDWIEVVAGAVPREVVTPTIQAHSAEHPAVRVFSTGDARLGNAVVKGLSVGRGPRAARGIAPDRLYDSAGRCLGRDGRDCAGLRLLPPDQSSEPGLPRR